MINLRDTNEDLFADSRMSFGEHLEDLRKVLVRSLICIAIGCVVGFWGAEWIVEVLQQPLGKAVVSFKQKLSREDLTERFGYIPPNYLPLLEQGMVPEQISVDPNQLVAAIQSVFPNFGEALDLRSVRFRGDQFSGADIVGICQQIAAGSATESGVVAIRNRIDAPDLDWVTKTSQLNDRSSVDLDRFVGILNRLLESPDLYQDAAFQDRFESPAWSMADFLNQPEELPLAAVKQTIEAADVDAVLAQQLQRKLNRRLVADVLSAHIQDDGLETVPLEVWRKTNYKPQSLGVTEPFFVWLKAGLLGGLTLSAPLVFYQLWTFIAAGLYPQEKKYVHVFLPISLILFAAGVLLAFFFVFGPVLEFLFTFNQTLNIAPEIRIGEWLSFAMFLPLGFGVAFQLPLVMFFVNRIGLITTQAYVEKWRIAIMVIFVLSMFLTPADPISMLLLAIPLTGLYFFGIGMCQFMPRPAHPFGEQP